MESQARTFKVVTSAVNEPTALIIGIAGETGTGKTVSAIRLALGMCRVVGGKPCLIDTNSRRGLHYRKPRGPFDYDYIDFKPPFGPLDYIAAIQRAIDAGNKVIIVDSASDEHNGEGGVMNQIDNFLNEKCGDDFQKREKWNMVAHARIKPQRSVLNRYIVQLGRTGVIVILCYRAHDKVKPETGKGIKHVGFEPETTSTLRFEMTQAFLLMPGAKGFPTVNPDTHEEKIWSKTPMQFEDWMKGAQLDEDMGEKMARWAAGDAEAKVPNCTAHGFPMTLRPAGNKKDGTPYPAHWKCPQPGCQQFVTDADWKASLQVPLVVTSSSGKAAVSESGDSPAASKVSPVSQAVTGGNGERLASGDVQGSPSKSSGQLLLPDDGKGAAPGALVAAPATVQTISKQQQAQLLTAAAGWGWHDKEMVDALKRHGWNSVSEIPVDRLAAFEQYLIERSFDETVVP